MSWRHRTTGRKGAALSDHHTNTSPRNLSLIHISFLGDAAEFQIQACDERILLIADAAFAFAVSQFGKQLVVIESRLDVYNVMTDT